MAKKEPRGYGVITAKEEAQQSRLDTWPEGDGHNV
jgi:hypothetical protein